MDRQPDNPPAIAFIAPSGTGKTTLLTGVIAELKKRGLRVGAIKYDAHRFEIDHAGKDSYRLTAAGADSMLISSDSRLAMVKQQNRAPSIEELVSTYCPDVDLVLVEGFRNSSLPKIELFRQGQTDSLISRSEIPDPALLAVATDTALDVDVPLLDLNSPSMVCDFILRALNT